MKPMTPREQYEHAQAVKRVVEAARKLEKLPDDYRTNENITVARARLEDWLDDAKWRWVK